MQKRIVNPWSWQDRFGFAQATEATAGERVLYCAGQTSVDDNGSPIHQGEMEAQVMQALDNLETVLHEADFELADIVRLTIYVTDIDAYFGAAPALGARLADAGGYASTLLGVARLALPELLVEIEATAVR